jgi:hypothetical protein
VKRVGMVGRPALLTVSWKVLPVEVPSSGIPR